MIAMDVAGAFPSLGPRIMMERVIETVGQEEAWIGR